MVRGGRVPDYLDEVSYLRGKKDLNTVKIELELIVEVNSL